MNGKEIDPLAFPGYRLVVKLGAGSNGTVYRGRELETQQLVALKVYHPGILGKAGFLRGLDSAVLSARGLVSENAAVAFGLIEGRSATSDFRQSGLCDWPSVLLTDWRQQKLQALKVRYCIQGI